MDSVAKDELKRIIESAKISSKQLDGIGECTYDLNKTIGLLEKLLNSNIK